MSDPRDDPRFFRHEYGRLVAKLSRRWGVRHLQAIEDAAQSALLAALESWTTGGVPEQPSAWLARVAQNHVVSELRTEARRDRLVARHGVADPDDGAPAPMAKLAADVDDDLLRMLFACCDDAIPLEGQLVLALKTLCGFDVREIAERLFVTEANVYKRLVRARERLRAQPFTVEDLTPSQLTSRLPAVQTILYLLFTEGHLSSHADVAIRRELCDEARRLTLVLAEHTVGQTPETFALLALMSLHAARISSRLDEAGGLLLLEEQDRAQWDADELARGFAWLAKSGTGEVFSRYHAEAAIAAEHALAPSFSETRWDRIVEGYEALERLAPSPVHTLNRAVAVAEWRGPDAGLAVVEGLAPPPWLVASYTWSAVLADLHRRCGHDDLARRHLDLALEAAPSAAVRQLLRRRAAAGPPRG